MDQSQTVIGTLKSPTMGVSVERMGQTLTLEPGQPVFWNDVIVNQGETLAVFELPAQSAAHGAAQLEIAPGAQAKLKAIESASTEIGPRTEVIAMTDGVELFEVSDQVNTAILTTAEGEMAGLAGVGLLAGGSALPGVALAGLGLLGLAATNDSNDEAPIDNGSGNGTGSGGNGNGTGTGGTGNGTGSGGNGNGTGTGGDGNGTGTGGNGNGTGTGGNGNGTGTGGDGNGTGTGTGGDGNGTGTGTGGDPTTPAEQLTGVSGLLVSAGDTLDEATASIPGVGMLVDAVTDVLGSGEGGVLPLPFGLADGLSELGSTLTDATADVPVGDVLGIVGGLLGGTEPVPATPEANGLTALLVDLSNTLATSTAGTPGLEQLGAALSDVVGSGQGGLIPLPGGLADVTNLLANGLGDAVPEGIPLISGLVGTLSQVVGNNLPTEPSADLLNVGNLTSGSPLSSPLASGSALPGLDALSGLLNPLTNGLG